MSMKGTYSDHRCYCCNPEYRVVRTSNNFLLAVMPVHILGEKIARDAAEAMAKDLGKGHHVEKPAKCDPCNMEVNMSKTIHYQPTPEEAAMIKEFDEPQRSWKPEVIADSTGNWSGNACRFATKAEAERYVHDLMMRWTSVRDTRVIPSSDPVNYKIENDELKSVVPDQEDQPPVRE